MSKLKYRSDIDGLRALAVLSVIIFHINKNWLPGGFVGVDIFFVISGYLITKIIYGEILSGTFSFSNFYIRRIKRILPLFFFVVLITTLLSSLVMLPDDFLFYMKSVASTLIFSSNMFFGDGVDYFSSNTEEYPLLHTWSLAVEEQYYIIFPIIMIAALKLFKKKSNVITVLLIICFSSFFLSEYSLKLISILKYNYYWLPTRAGEMIIGSITAIYMFKKEPITESSWVLSFSGFLMVILSIFLLKESAAYPGIVAIIPCLGAALIISSGGSNAGMINKLLSLKLVVTIGLMSYSLYLWHWPILSIMRYVSNDGILTRLQICIAVFIIFLMSYASWKFIETPCRKLKLSLFSAASLFYLIPSVIFACLAYYAIETNGYPARYGSEKDKMLKESTYMYTDFCHNKEVGNCTFGDASKAPDTYMIGDSHAGHYTPMLDEIGKKNGFSFVSKTVDACYPLLDVNGQYPSAKEPFYTYLCPQLIQKASVEYKNYKNIVLAGVWSEHMRLHPEFMGWLENMVSTLTKEGKNVFIIEQVPMFKPGVYEHAFRQRFSIVNITKITGNKSDLSTMRVDIDKPANDKLRELVSRYENAYFLDPITSLGRESKKLPFYKGHLVYKDNGHLNEFGSRLIGDDIADKTQGISLLK